MNDTDRVAHHETLARIARREAATYRSYLDWSTDPDQREWAEKLARSCEIAAEAEETFAAALEARGKAAAAWGPDYEHYCIVECKECGCRSWTVEYPPLFSPERPKYQRRSLVQMAAESPRPDAGSVLLATVLLGLLVTGLVGAFLLGEQRRCESLRETGSALVERYCGTEAGG
jgi:transglutaminase-like putative cysteine protease